VYYCGGPYKEQAGTVPRCNARMNDGFETTKKISMGGPAT
jgi:hypothetical protein